MTPLTAGALITQSPGLGAQPRRLWFGTEFRNPWDAGRSISHPVVAVNPFGQRSLPAEADVTVVATATAPSSVRVYPNPWRADRPTNVITFDGLTDNSTVKIFTISGRWVRTLSSTAGAVNWDLKNDSGDPVASGLMHLSHHR